MARQRLYGPNTVRAFAPSSLRRRADVRRSQLEFAFYNSFIATTMNLCSCFDASKIPTSSRVEPYICLKVHPSRLLTGKSPRSHAHRMAIRWRQGRDLTSLHRPAHRLSVCRAQEIVRVKRDSGCTHALEDIIMHMLYRLPACRTRLVPSPVNTYTLESAGVYQPLDR